MVCARMLSFFSRVPLFVTLWTVGHQAPLSMGFPRQEYWSGLQCLSPGALPNPGIEPTSPTLLADSLTTGPHGKSKQPIISLQNPAYSFSFFFFWSIVDLQYCVSFRCTAKWFHIYTYICILLDYFPLQVITRYWMWLPVLYSKSLLIIYFMYSSLYLGASLMAQMIKNLPLM